MMEDIKNLYVKKIIGGKSGRAYLIIGPANPQIAATIRSKIYDLIRSLDTH